MRKKISKMLAVMLLLQTSAFSQVEKGTWLVGGSGSFEHGRTYTQNPGGSFEAKNTSMQLTPDAGIFLLDKFAAGLRITYEWRKSEVIDPGGGKTNTTRIYAGPFLRYYFLPTDGRVNLIGDASAQFGALYWLKDKGNISTYSLMAGPVFFLNTVVGIELLMGYKQYYEDQPNGIKNSYNNFQISAGLQIHLEKQ